MPGTRKPFKSTSASVSTPSAGSPSPRPGSIGCTSLECEPRSRFSPVSDEKHGIFMVFSWYFPWKEGVERGSRNVHSGREEKKKDIIDMNDMIKEKALAWHLDEGRTKHLFNSHVPRIIPHTVCVFLVSSHFFVFGLSFLLCLCFPLRSLWTLSYLSGISESSLLLDGFYMLLRVLVSPLRGRRCSAFLIFCLPDGLVRF